MALGVHDKTSEIATRSVPCRLFQGLRFYAEEQLKTGGRTSGENEG